MDFTLDPLMLGHVVADPPPREIERERHARERRPQFVRDVAEQLLLRDDEVFYALRHPIELAREFRQLVAPLELASFGDAHGEIAFGELTRRAAQGANRPSDVERQPQADE